MVDDQPLAEQQKRLLQAIQAHNGEWVSRSQIAQTLGHKRLNPYEVAALEFMVSSGAIEGQKVDRVVGAINYQWVYRVKQAK